MTVDELHEQINNFIRQEEHALVLNVNVHCMNLMYDVSWLRPFLNSAEIVFCDGIGVVIGAWMLGEYLPQRITYADWMWQLCAFAESEGHSLFLLGAKEGISEQARDKLMQTFPQLNIVGTHHGYFTKTPEHPENQAVIEVINRTKPDILMVSFGMPLQEKWLLENWDSLDANVALTGGAALDYISGNLRRAPKWMTDNGLEWLGRLIIEPRRLWQRYVIGNPLFLFRVLQYRIAKHQHE